MNKYNVLQRSLILTFAFFANTASAQGLLDRLTSDTTQRSGTLNYINVSERAVVIDDQSYRLSPSARLTSAVTSQPGKRVNYTIVGEGGGQRGQVVLITPASKKAKRNRE